MLDKTIPYYDVIMKADATVATKHPLPSLPQGYHFKMYEMGDEQHWAALECKVEEFEDVSSAMSYFNRVFLPHQSTLRQRMAFIIDSNNTYVATATAWFKDSAKRHYAVLHWVSSDPSVQGKGLGKAIVIYALSKFKQVEPAETEIFLHTQTWSYKAIGLYGKLGFKITNTPLLEQTTNEQALPILKTYLTSDIYSNLLES